MSEAFDASGAADDAAANALISAAAKEQGKEVKSPGTPDTDAAAEAAKAAAEAKALTDAAAEAKAKADAEAAAKSALDLSGGETYEYKPTGDPGLDIALGFIGKLGFSAENPAVQAATKGDFGAIEAAMASLGDKSKGFEQYLALAKTAFETRQKAGEAKVKAAEEAVYQAVGGKEVWDKVAAHTKAKADDAEKAQISAALEAGGMQAAGMAVLLLRAYQRDNPHTPNFAKGGAGGGGASGSNTLSAREYADEVKKLRGKIRGPIDNHPDYLALRQKFAQSNQ